MPRGKAAETAETKPAETFVVMDSDYDTVSADQHPYKDRWPSLDEAMQVATGKVISHGDTYFVGKVIARVERAKPPVEVVTL